MFLFIF